MMSKKPLKFKTEQARVEGGDWVTLSLSSYVEESEEASASLSDPLISETCGDSVDYGKLFAYCFRRFGYPVRGWDNYKELVRYYLTTPRKDVLLLISPYVGDVASLSIRVLVSGERHSAVRAYAQAARLAWRQRFLTWLETKYKDCPPEWVPEWLTEYNQYGQHCSSEFCLVTDWLASVNQSFPLGSEGSRLHELSLSVIAFRAQEEAAYRLEDAFPDYYMRPADVTLWNDDDPLKAIYQAAKVALLDLQSPVGVRDAAINMFGLVDKPGKRSRAKSAGYPSGALGNDAPVEMAELHALVMKLGRGSARSGIRKLLKFHNMNS